MGMRSIISALVFSLVAATSVTAQGGEAVCKDGSTSVEGRGACSHHGGVAKHHSERKSARKHAEPRTEHVDRHAQARHDRVRTRTPTPDREIDRKPRETTEPGWIERHFDKTHESNQP